MKKQNYNSRHQNLFKWLISSVIAMSITGMTGLFAHHSVHADPTPNDPSTANRAKPKAVYTLRNTRSIRACGHSASSSVPGSAKRSDQKINNLLNSPTEKNNRGNSQQNSAPKSSNSRSASTGSSSAAKSKSSSQSRSSSTNASLSASSSANLSNVVNDATSSLANLYDSDSNRISADYQLNSSQINSLEGSLYYLISFYPYQFSDDSTPSAISQDYSAAENGLAQFMSSVDALNHRSSPSNQNSKAESSAAQPASTSHSSQSLSVNSSAYHHANHNLNSGYQNGSADATYKSEVAGIISQAGVDEQKLNHSSSAASLTKMIHKDQAAFDRYLYLGVPASTFNDTINRMRDALNALNRDVTASHASVQPKKSAAQTSPSSASNAGSAHQHPEIHAGSANGDNDGPTSLSPIYSDPKYVGIPVNVYGDNNQLLFTDHTDYLPNIVSSGSSGINADQIKAGNQISLPTYAGVADGFADGYTVQDTPATITGTVTKNGITWNHAVNLYPESISGNDETKVDYEYHDQNGNPMNISASQIFSGNTNDPIDLNWASGVPSGYHIIQATMYGSNYSANHNDAITIHSDQSDYDPVGAYANYTSNGATGRIPDQIQFRLVPGGIYNAIAAIGSDAYNIDQSLRDRNGSSVLSSWVSVPVAREYAGQLITSSYKSNDYFDGPVKVVVKVAPNGIVNHLKYVDDKGQVVGTGSAEGPAGTKYQPSPDQVPQGYKLINPPQTYQFTNQSVTWNVPVKSRTVASTIYFRDDHHYQEFKHDAEASGNGHDNHKDWNDSHYPKHYGSWDVKGSNMKPISYQTAINQLPSFLRVSSDAEVIWNQQKPKYANGAVYYLNVDPVKNVKLANFQYDYKDLTQNGDYSFGTGFSNYENVRTGNLLGPLNQKIPMKYISELVPSGYRIYGLTEKPLFYYFSTPNSINYDDVNDSGNVEIPVIPNQTKDSLELRRRYDWMVLDSNHRMMNLITANDGQASALNSADQVYQSASQALSADSTSGALRSTLSSAFASFHTELTSGASEATSDSNLLALSSAVVAEMSPASAGHSASSVQPQSSASHAQTKPSNSASPSANSRAKPSSRSNRGSQNGSTNSANQSSSAKSTSQRSSQTSSASLTSQSSSQNGSSSQTSSAHSQSSSISSATIPANSQSSSVSDTANQTSSSNSQNSSAPSSSFQSSTVSSSPTVNQSQSSSSSNRQISSSSQTSSSVNSVSESSAIFQSDLDLLESEVGSLANSVDSDITDSDVDLNQQQSSALISQVSSEDNYYRSELRSASDVQADDNDYSSASSGLDQLLSRASSTDQSDVSQSSASSASASASLSIQSQINQSLASSASASSAASSATVLQSRLAQLENGVSGLADSADNTVSDADSALNNSQQTNWLNQIGQLDDSYQGILRSASDITIGDQEYSSASDQFAQVVNSAQSENQQVANQVSAAASSAAHNRLESVMSATTGLMNQTSGEIAADRDLDNHQRVLLTNQLKQRGNYYRSIFRNASAAQNADHYYSSASSEFSSLANVAQSENHDDQFALSADSSARSSQAARSSADASINASLSASASQSQSAASSFAKQQSAPVSRVARQSHSNSAESASTRPNLNSNSTAVSGSKSSSSSSALSTSARSEFNSTPATSSETSSEPTSSTPESPTSVDSESNSSRSVNEPAGNSGQHNPRRSFNHGSTHQPAQRSNPAPESTSQPSKRVAHAKHYVAGVNDARRRLPMNPNSSHQFRAYVRGYRDFNRLPQTGDRHVSLLMAIMMLGASAMSMLGVAEGHRRRWF